MALTQNQIDAGWNEVLDVIGVLDIPKGNVSVTQAHKAYESWADRVDATIPLISRPRKPFTSSELQLWEAELKRQQSSAAKLSESYPQKKMQNTAGGTAIQIQEEKVFGALPWWYWPLRVGAGVSAGYITYRLLSPEPVQQASFAELRRR